MATAKKRPTPFEQVMENRKANLKIQLAIHGSNHKLGVALGYSNGTYISQLIGANPTRPITETLARSIEMKLHLPFGWMDATPAPQEMK